MIIINNESRVRKIAGVFLFPSLNKINAEDSKKLEAHSDFKYAVDKGNFTIRNESVKKSEKTDDIVEYIHGLSVKESKQEIKEIYDIRKLKEIKESDNRSGVIKAVEKQLETMEVNLDNEEN